MSKNVKISNPMKVITCASTRWSYANVWEPKSINGGTPKYSVSLIIPKSDTKTIAKIKAAIEAAYNSRATVSRYQRFPSLRHLCATVMQSVRTTRPTRTLTSSTPMQLLLPALWTQT